MNTENLNILYSEFDILDILETDNQIIITLKSKNNFAVCPHCGKESKKIHQKYDKMIQDLPINNKNVTLIIKSKVYRCDELDCYHFSFNEQFELFNALDKKTKRLINYIIELSKKDTCRGVAKILNNQGVIISKATVNNIYKKNR